MGSIPPQIPYRFLISCRQANFVGVGGWSWSRSGVSKAGYRNNTTTLTITIIRKSKQPTAPHTRIMPATSKIDRYKLDAEFSAGTITHTKRLQDGQLIDTPGTTWTREKKLGAGGFGTVWGERHVPTGELRAVKVLSKLQLNVREVEALVDLQDVNLPLVAFRHVLITNIYNSIQPILSRFSVGSTICTRSISLWNTWRTAI